MQQLRKSELKLIESMEVVRNACLCKFFPLSLEVERLNPVRSETVSSIKEHLATVTWNRLLDFDPLAKSFGENM